MLVRAHHTFLSRISGSFSLEEWKATNYRRFYLVLQRLQHIQALPSLLLRCTCRRILRPDMRVKFQEIISLSTLHIYYTLNFFKIQILFSLSHSVFSHLRNLQAGRFGVETQESNSL